ALQKLARGVGRDAVVLVLVRDQRAVGPDRPLVAAPVERERPARQLLARIPLALAVMQESVRRETRAQALDQLCRERALVRAGCRRVPFGRIGIVARDEGRLAADRDPHVVAQQLPLDALAERVARLPLFVAVRLRDAR